MELIWWRNFGMHSVLNRECLLRCYPLWKIWKIRSITFAGGNYQRLPQSQEALFFGFCLMERGETRWTGLAGPLLKHPRKTRLAYRVFYGGHPLFWWQGQHLNERLVRQVFSHNDLPLYDASSFIPNRWRFRFKSSFMSSSCEKFCAIISTALIIGVTFWARHSRRSCQISFSIGLPELA